MYFFEFEREDKEKKDKGRAIYCKLYGEKEKESEKSKNNFNHDQDLVNRNDYATEKEYSDAFQYANSPRIYRMLKKYEAFKEAENLNISNPNDKEEIEADELADKVIRKKRSSQEMFDKHMEIIEKYKDESPITRLEHFIQEIYMNPDFSSVNIHTDDKAAESAEALNARAFTKGKDIYFNKGEFKPGTEDGDRLIAHEMAHVMQGGEGVRCKIKLDENEELLLTDIEPDIIKDILKNDLVSSYALRKLGNKPVLVRNGNILDIDLINNPVLKKYLYDLSKKITPGQKFTPSSSDLKTLEKEMETYLDMISSMKTRDISGDIAEDDDDLSKVNIPSEPIGK